MQKLKNKMKGFTIIEVLIVLAIAGLILLIVFLAVPALQRNSRNTQRRNDVSSILGGMSEYASNNNGKLPNQYAIATYTLSNSAGADTTAIAKVGYYTSAASPGFITAFATGTQAALATDDMRIVTGAKCGGAGATTSTGAGARSIAVQFSVEGSGGLVASCQDS